MFSRFTGISHQEYAIRNGQARAASGLPTLGKSRGPSLGRTKGSALGQVMTRPLCLCKLMNEADAMKKSGRY